MELVPIIWNTLLFGSIFLMIVLLISFIASKLKKKAPKVYNEFDLVPDRPVIITRRHQNPNIKVTSSKYEKVRAKRDNSLRIFDINEEKRKISNKPSYENVYSRNTGAVSQFDGSHYGGSSKRNQRFTVLNETINTSTSIHKHLNVGNSYRFTDTDFS